MSPSLKRSAYWRPLELSRQADPGAASLRLRAKLPCVGMVARLPKAALAVERSESKTGVQLAESDASSRCNPRLVWWSNPSLERPVNDKPHITWGRRAAAQLGR